VDVGGGDGDGERYAFLVDQQEVLDARPTAVRGVGPLRSLPPFCRYAIGVEARSRPVDPTGEAELVEQDAVQPVPDARPLPVPQAPPAGHAAAEDQLLGEHAPRYAAPQHDSQVLSF